MAEKISYTSGTPLELGGDLGHLPISGSLDFTFGWDVTAAQARANSEAMEDLKQRCWDELTGHRIFLRLSGVLRMDMALDNVHWTTVGRAISGGYGTVTYDAALGTITRSAGDWTAGGFVATGAIKVVDPTNPNNNEIHMILSVNTTVITVRSDGNDKNVQESGTTTDATFTPLTGGERSALAICGDHHASFILARYGRGHACIVYGSSTNDWTDPWIPGGGAATSADTYFNQALFAHGVEFYSPNGGSGLVVQNGNPESQHYVGSIRVGTKDTTFAAMYLWNLFTGVFKNVCSWDTAGIGVEASGTNGIRINVTLEQAGTRGIVWNGSGNTINGLVQTSPGYGIDIDGNDNNCGGLYLENNHYTPTINDWNPQIRVAGKNNIFSGRLNNTVGQGLPTAVFVDRDAAETTRFVANLRLPLGFDLRSVAKPYSENRDSGIAHFSMDHAYRDQCTLLVSAATSLAPSTSALVDVDIDPVLQTFTRHAGDWTAVYSADDWVKVARLGNADGLYHINAVTAPVDEVQSAATSTGTGGTFRLNIRFGTGHLIITADIAFDAIYSVIETAIDVAATGIVGWSNGDITVGGGGTKWDAGPTTFNFDGTFVTGRDHPLIVADDTSLTGGSSGAITQTTAGVLSVMTLESTHDEELHAINTTGSASFGRGMFLLFLIKRIDSVTFTNSTSIISRSTGSWIDDGYLVGGLAYVTGPNANLNAGTHLITALTAANMTVLTTLVDDAATNIDVQPIGPGATPNSACFWWDGPLLKFYIPPNTMDRARLVRIFDRLTSANDGGRTQWVGLPIKSGQRLYWDIEVEVDTPSWYVDRLPLANSADIFTLEWGLAGIGFTRSSSHTFGPGVHRNTGYFDATSDDTIASNDLQLLIAHQAGDGTEDGVSDGGSSSSTRLHDTTGTPFSAASVGDWLWNITEDVYVRVTNVVDSNNIDTDAVTSWSGDTYNFGINPPIVGTIHKFEVAVGS